MPRLTINDIACEFKDGDSVLKAALDNGIDIPHFCWHPKLSVSGNCRLCSVEMEGCKDLVLACNTKAEEGMSIITESERINKARGDVLELFLVNHPLDCPVCDKSGECLLQDYYFKYSGRASRFDLPKVKKGKVIDIGKNLMLDDERCVLCTRCVRFLDEIAKDDSLSVAGRGDCSFLTPPPLRSVDSPYSLNTVDVCPVGALTSKDFRFKKRVWLLKSAETICPGCSNGCEILADHSGGVIYRFRPKVPSEFICDTGRLSYKDYQGENRLKEIICHPLRSEGPSVATLSDAGFFDLLRMTKDIVVVISPFISCEEITKIMELLNGARFLVSAPDDDPDFADNIIRKGDRSPNYGFIKGLGVKRLEDELSAGALIVIDRLFGDDILKVAGFGVEKIIQFAFDRRFIVPKADVVFPMATFLEEEGSFVNFAGASQRFSKVLEPAVGVKKVSEWIEILLVSPSL